MANQTPAVVMDKYVNAPLYRKLRDPTSSPGAAYGAVLEAIQSFNSVHMETPIDADLITPAARVSLS